MHHSKIKYMLKKIIDFFLDTIQSITISLSIFVVIYLFLGRPTEVLGYSMEPSLDNYDRMIVEKVTGSVGDYKRGDIVVVASPVAEDTEYVKRITGMPGDDLTIRDCRIYIVNSGNT